MSELGFRKFVNILAFLGIILCAVGVAVGKWFPLFGEIASWIALFVTALSAFLFVKAKRNPVYLLVFFIALGVIVGFKIWILI